MEQKHRKKTYSRGSDIGCFRRVRISCPMCGPSVVHSSSQIGCIFILDLSITNKVLCASGALELLSNLFNSQCAHFPTAELSVSYFTQVIRAIRKVEHSKKRLRTLIDQLLAVCLDTDPSLMEGLPRMQLTAAVKHGTLRALTFEQVHFSYILSQAHHTL